MTFPAYVNGTRLDAIDLCRAQWEQACEEFLYASFNGHSPATLQHLARNMQEAATAFAILNRGYRP